MVERRLLTPSFVDEVQPASSGERWIADTKIRGFGLRVWSVRQGGGKALAVRVTDLQGKIVRRTFSERWSWPDEERTLGVFLEEAREWARDEIDRIKGRPTVSDELTAIREAVRKALAARTLNDLVLARLDGMRGRGLTEAYVHTLTKLYVCHVPEKLRQTRMQDILPTDIADCLRALDTKPGSARILRGFFGHILENAAEFDWRLHRVIDKARQLYSPEYERRRVGYGTHTLPVSLFKAIFHRLENESKSWMQAAFIRLLFEMNVPADRLMRAEWSHIIDGIWYPWLPGERKYWWGHRRHVDEDTMQILDHLRSRTEREIGQSPFIFPSRQSATGHIRSFDVVWRHVAAEVNVDHCQLNFLVHAYDSAVLFPRRLRRIRSNRAAQA